MSPRRQATLVRTAVSRVVHRQAARRNQWRCGRTAVCVMNHVSCRAGSIYCSGVPSLCPLLVRGRQRGSYFPGRQHIYWKLGGRLLPRLIPKRNPI